MKQNSFKFDLTQIKHQVGDAVFQQGQRLYQSHSVKSVNISDNKLLAKVQSESADAIYQTQLFNTTERPFTFHCSCDNGAICQHIVATMIAVEKADFVDDYQQRLKKAFDTALNQRVKKGKNEVDVELINGSLEYGCWKAESILSATYKKISYHVYFRSLEAGRNYCTCPDWATNQLGSCKHIEAVIHKIRHHPSFSEHFHSELKVSYIYLCWKRAFQPEIRLHLSAHANPNLSEFLAQYFNSTGRFSQSFPDDFQVFLQKSRSFSGLDVGDDVRVYMQQVLADLQRQAQQEKLYRKIIQDFSIQGMKRPLANYQLEGMAFLVSRGRAMLVDEIGLGKTAQAVVAAHYLHHNTGLKKVLIVAPTALLSHWHTEIRLYSDLPVQQVSGSTEQRAGQFQAKAFFFLLDLKWVNKDLDRINNNLSVDLLILDEAQHIKDWRSKTASSIKLINSHYVFVLSGIQLENRIEEIYSLMQLIDPRIMGPLWRCLLEYQQTDRHGQVIAARQSNELEQRLKPVRLGRARQTVQAELPAFRDVQLLIPLEPKWQSEQEKQVRRICKVVEPARFRPLQSKEVFQFLQILKQSLKLAQQADKSLQLIRLLEEICLQGQRKVIIFSQWRLKLEKIKPVLEAAGISVLYPDNCMNESELNSQFLEFNEKSTTFVLLMVDQLQPIVEFTRVDVLIHLDLNPSPSMMHSRLDWFSSNQKLLLYWLIAQSTFEQDLAYYFRQQTTDVLNEMFAASKEELENLQDKRWLEQLIKPFFSTGERLFPQTSTDEIINKETVKGKTIHLADDETLKALMIEYFSQRLEAIYVFQDNWLIVVKPVHQLDYQHIENWSADSRVLSILAHSDFQNLIRLKRIFRLDMATQIYNK